MRRGHFEHLAPVCPRCLGDGRQAPLSLASVAREADGHVLEGAIHCSAPECRLEFPILDGVPILVPDPRAWLAENLWAVTARDDLSPLAEGMIGDGAGPGSHFDVSRQHLSSYAWDHYGGLDPQEPDRARAGALSRCLEGALATVGTWPGTAIDIGCAVGRSSFDLAACGSGLVLGLDLGFGMLRLAQRVLREGRVRYPRRRIGIVYDRCDFPVAFAGAERVDFWCCNAQALPFADRSVGLATAFNLLDCLPNPLGFLAGLDRVIGPGGAAVLSTPFDWSPSATAVEGWIGGHSQRGPHGGDGEALLRDLLTPGVYPQSTARLRLAAESDTDWQVRLHARSIMLYRSRLVVARTPLA